MARNRNELTALIEANQAAYLNGWLEPDQYAWNMTLLSSELDELEREEAAAASA